LTASGIGAAFEACAAQVRRADPDRYFSALFAPTGQRPFLFALYAFNHELAHVGETVHEPMLGEIRLQWWRETLESARRGSPRRHDVAEALAATFASVALPEAPFEAMIEARSLDLLGGAPLDRAAYLDATSANIMRLAARVLGGEDRFDDLAREAGAAYGIAGLMRNARLAANSETIADARTHFLRARRMAKPKRCLPAFLPAALVPLYLRGPAKEVSIHRRQLALLSASLRGRI
jgi:phytoene/squalene synthetase